MGKQSESGNVNGVVAAFTTMVAKQAARNKRARVHTLHKQQGGRERSDWGFFGCTRAAVNDTQQSNETKAQLHRLTLDPPVPGCDGSVTFLKPIAGDGTDLMHGDFARRVSPSGEALSWFIVQNRAMFADKRVLELGSGLGMSGLAVAVWTDAKHVEMTDGDPTVVNTLEKSVRLSEAAFAETGVGVHQLLWEHDATTPTEEEQYDLLIAGEFVILPDPER